VQVLSYFLYFLNAEAGDLLTDWTFFVFGRGFLKADLADVPIFCGVAFLAFGFVTGVALLSVFTILYTRSLIFSSFWLNSLFTFLALVALLIYITSYFNNIREFMVSIFSYTCYMHGFLNLGNTCYFNSAIQSLLHILQISEHIYKTRYVGDCKFTKLYHDLVTMYFSRQESNKIDLTPLLKEFQILFPRFKLHEPHDTQDALFCIIDILEKEYGIIKRLIYGKKTQITISPDGKNTSDTDYSIQTLTIDDHVCKVSDLINKSMNWNTLEGYVDDNGKVHHVATTRTIFKQLQPLMIISFDKKSRIQIEEDLSFTDDIKYSLQSCVIHEGVQWGGHYYSMCKFNDKWYVQDDDHIAEVNLKEIDGYYILIYILKNQ